MTSPIIAAPSSLSVRPLWSRRNSLQPMHSSSRSIRRISVVLVSPSTSAALRKLLYRAQARNDRRSSQDASRTSSVRCCVTAAPRCNSCCIPQIPARYGAHPEAGATIDARSGYGKGHFGRKGTISICCRGAPKSSVQPARRSELAALADMANRLVPGSSDHGTRPRAILQFRSRQHPDLQPKGQTAWRGGVSLSQRPRA